MAVESLPELKAYFEEGDFPTAAQCGNLIDSLALGKQVVSTSPSDHDVAGTSGTLAWSLANGDSGGTVHLPKGTYAWQSQITLTQPVVIEGNGPGTVLNVTVSGASGQAAIYASGVDGITIRNLTLNILNANQGENYYGLRFLNCNQTTIENVEIVYGHAGVRFDSDKGAGVHTHNKGNVVRNSRIHDQFAYGIDSVHSNGLQILGNRIYDVGVDTSQGDGIKLRAESLGTDTGNINFQITGNTIYGNTRDGMDLYDGGGGGLVSSNSIFDNGYMGIDFKGDGSNRFQARNTAITGNNIRNCGTVAASTAGVQIRSTRDGPSFTGNVITECAEHGLQIEDSFGATIGENTITRNGKNGILVGISSAVSYNTFIGNIVKDNNQINGATDYYGLYVSAFGDRNIFTGNLYMNDSTATWLGYQKSGVYVEVGATKNQFTSEQAVQNVQYGFDFSTATGNRVVNLGGALNGTALFNNIAGQSYLYFDETTGDPMTSGTMTYQITTGAKLGSTGAGWTVDDATDRAGLAKLPASQTAETLVVPITGLHVGQTISGYTVRGQIESAGNTATLDCALRKITVAAADLSDAAVTSGAISQVSVTADTAVAAAVTGLSETIAATTSYYLLLTGTTGANTDIDAAAISLTVTRP